MFPGGLCKCEISHSECVVDFLCLDLGRTHWRSLLIKRQGKIRDDDSNPSLSWEHSS